MKDKKIKINLNNFKSKNKHRGFTIVETLVTLLAITVMISAPLVFMSKSHNYSEIIRAKIIATSLSQEGLELATSIRNQNLANFQTLAATCTPSVDGGCMIDWNGISDTPTLAVCQTDSCQLFSQSNVEGNMFRRIGDTPTGYYRYVTFTANGTQAYNAESVVYTFIDELKVEVKLTKILSNIEIK